ncbi:MAG: hypothetical protein QGG40_20150, partial [Myxococcota bacterium]|nr:hypothetical protein [Myxococcota bacterium]
MTHTAHIVVLTGLALLAACAHPAHLQEDFGESYRQVFEAQADLPDSPDPDSPYALGGKEGLLIRF